MTELLKELEAQSKWLRKAAAEIAAEGHTGWGNTCTQAADVLDTHHAEIAEALAEIASLRQATIEDHDLREKLTSILKRTANALKGEPEPLHSHSWHDLPEVAAEAVKDAERWRALHWAEAPMVTVTGSQLARGIRPGDFAVPWDWPITSRTRIRMIVMNNSAREVGE